MLPKDFINKVKDAAMQTQIKYGIPASITISQAAWESGWGDSTLTKKANNFFGIKASKDWDGKIFNIDTGEFTKAGQYYIDKLAAFRSYATPFQSFIDHANFLIENKRYKSLFETLDPMQWADGLQKAGYGTDPRYSDKLKGTIKQYNLTKFDKQAASNETVIDTTAKHIRRNKVIWGVSGAFVLLLGGILIYRYKRHETT